MYNVHVHVSVYVHVSVHNNIIITLYSAILSTCTWHMLMWLRCTFVFNLLLWPWWADYGRLALGFVWGCWVDLFGTSGHLNTYQWIPASWQLLGGLSNHRSVLSLSLAQCHLELSYEIVWKIVTDRVAIQRGENKKREEVGERVCI